MHSTQSEATPGVPSVLAIVANHEKNLLAERDAAKQQAAGMIESAHNRAAALLEDEEAKLAAEVAALRQEASAARDAEREKILASNQAKWEQARQQALARVPEMAREIVAMTLPKGPGKAVS